MVLKLPEFPPAAIGEQLPLPEVLLDEVLAELELLEELLLDVLELLLDELEELEELLLDEDELELLAEEPAPQFSV